MNKEEMIRAISQSSEADENISKKKKFSFVHEP